ncbi:FadR family transcriptional regulator [Mycetocola tolaasinivorans]|uniref:FadR family transcriptional regulator n=1 Tax=Mycetocola tolaasinivorans TaxID=76635 RepID=A0A3L7A6I8_9MICO|nr:FCD domain-containing protein [Mycetocola tolaasinivorans]RLP75498.1 FadR family transcriptional regulator [Mycetocola tolaasinivorans]
MVESRAWQVVLERIEHDLLSGTLQPGDHLPGERALAADLGVGRSSVREALRVLEVLGLIRTASGSGPRSGAIIVALPSGGMSALMRLQVAAQGFSVEDIVQTRLILETETVSRLAENPDLRTIHTPRTLLGAMESQNLSPEEFLTLDAQFHLSLTEAMGNHVLTATMAGLRSSIEDYVRAGLPRLASWPATATRLRHEHRALADAIGAGDAERARSVIHDHITGYYLETGLAEDVTATPVPEPAS